MKSPVSVVSALLGLALLVGSCVSSDSPTGVPEGHALVGLALQPSLIPSAADGSAAPINRIRAVTTRRSDNVELDVTEVDVSPTDASWELVLTIPTSGATTVVVVTLYLIHVADDGTETVEFSGRLEVTLTTGVAVSPDIPLVRGPIASMFATAVTITSAPEIMAEGTTRALTAVATTSESVQPTIFWTSLNPGVITMAGSTATAVTAGTARIVASAGAFADTVSITVTPSTVDAAQSSVAVSVSL